MSSPAPLSPNLIPPNLIRLSSPLGDLELTGDDSEVWSLAIIRQGHLPLEGLPESPNALLDQATRELTEYFAGDRVTFDVPVRLSVGTEFQRSVWQGLAAIPFGDHLSYGELGRSIGKSGAGRAIGGAVGANPAPILVGCHRVLASNGRITGFSAGEGIPTKQWLLRHEGIEYVG
ncbi:methylated-DNA--[protein]-cysteine S-methyltransferase [Cryobacterium arcticum]|uniref:Methylated-DNA--protein-cysteine methyltransferase n=1 Tax=Cryobacterium arcticum TaxID=670052 RepID=A0A317ZUI1_9MICO|nr:methylated-DNA--[protein]-cysteine S-methyltransferase [Cryobacterium arcticum]PXA70909.1 methylated-DNA--[protein]-cysteine S-methyltransferase [Cryobacterium arcticum]